MSIYDTRIMSTLGIYISAVGTTFVTNLLYIYLGNYQLRIKSKTFTFSKKLTVFLNNGISSVDHILSAFAKSTTTVNIARNHTCTLLSQQSLKIVVLTDKLITG